MRRPLVVSSTVAVGKKKGAAIGPFQPQKPQTLPGTFPDVSASVVAKHRTVPRKLGNGDNLSRQVTKQEVKPTAVISGSVGIYNSPNIPILAPVDDQPTGVDPVTLHPVYPTLKVIGGQ